MQRPNPRVLTGKQPAISDIYGPRRYLRHPLFTGACLSLTFIGAQAIRKGKDPTLFLIVLEDSAALLGLLVALTGIALASRTGMPLFDGAASVIIGLILGGTAVIIALGTKGLLVGEVALVEVVQAIREIVAVRGSCPARERSADPAHGTGIHRGHHKPRFRR